MSPLLVLYFVTVAFSFGVLYHEYRTGEPIYRFSLKEKVINLIIVPLIPIFNLVIAYAFLNELAD